MKVRIVSSFGSSGKPLSALSDLIEKRVKYLGETARDSIAATAIDCFKSIRANTKRFRGKVKIENG